MFNLVEHYRVYINKLKEEISYKISYPNNGDIDMYFTLMEIRNSFNNELPSYESIIKAYKGNKYKYPVVYYSNQNITWYNNQYKKFPKEVKSVLLKLDKTSHIEYKLGEKEYYTKAIISEEELFYLILKYPDTFSEDFIGKIKVEMI